MNPTAELCEFEEEKHLAIYFVEFIPALSIVCYFSFFVFFLKPNKNKIYFVCGETKPKRDVVKLNIVPECIKIKCTPNKKIC